MTVETRVQQIQVLAVVEPDPKGAGTKNRKINYRNDPGSGCTWGLCVVGLRYRNSCLQVSPGRARRAANPALPAAGQEVVMVLVLPKRCLWAFEAGDIWYCFWDP